MAYCIKYQEDNRPQKEFAQREIGIHEVEAGRAASHQRFEDLLQPVLRRTFIREL